MKGKGSGTQLTSLFPDYWEICLALINDGNDHPKLVWGPYPTEGTSFNVTGYNIYRAVGSMPDPRYATFILLSSVPANQFDYVDEQYSIGRGWYGFYKITAVDQTVESEFSNIVMTGIDAFRKENNSDNVKNDVLDYSLSQNYPNPFNPNTKFEYLVSEDGLVVLRIYDILGNEVASLVNERKSAGKYFIEFNASDLPSGIYVYKFMSGEFIESKKMILLR